MNRIDRISAILIQLQSKRVLTGQAIADRFSISLRTAYRDIKTLEEAGVPIVSEAGVGYSLMEGYRLPPVMFTKEEATAFLTAEKLVEKLTDAATFKIYEAALYKIKAVLRSDEKEHLENMYRHIEVIENRYLPKDNKTSNTLQLVLNSITQKCVLKMEYFANHSQQSSSRNVEAIGIFFDISAWYLIAYCWMRKDYRTFRIDRITQLESTFIPFKQQHPPLKNYLKTLTQEKRELVKVVMRVNKTVLKYLGEQKYYQGFVSEKEVNDRLEQSFLTASLEGFARWFMMFGDNAEIVSPPALKARILELATAIKNNDFAKSMNASEKEKGKK